MDTIWVGIGIGVLGLTLLDVFLTALNYDEAGFLAGRLAAWQWGLTRRITRRMSRRWRPIALRQVTGLQIMVTVLAWIGGVILGFGLIYLGLMQGKSFLYDGVNADAFGAIYFSAAQLATVGTSQLTPNTDLLRVLSIAETLTGVVLVSLILTFLLGVYDVISSLRALSSQFFSAGRGIGEPIASLKPYFPNGESRGLDGHLDSIADSFGSYTDGIRLHHAAYYFQSGRDTFSLPYSIRMMGGIVGGLRWGLPHGHPVTQEPTLLPLTEQFEQFQSYMHPLLRWKSTAVPETLSREEFRRQIATDASVHHTHGHRARTLAATVDPWVARFGRVNRQMAALVHTEALGDVDEAYERYTEWLPFAYRAQRFTTAICHDLDYQPVYSAGSAEEPDAQPDVPPRSRPQRWRTFLNRRMTLIDPGYTRLLGAVRVLSAAALTVLVVAVGLSVLGLPVMPTAAFAGMIAMFAGSGGGGSGTRGLGRFAGIIAIVPVLVAIAINTVIPHETLISAVVLVLLAFVGMALSRFGPAIGGLGQLGFMAFYFILLLRLSPKDFVLYAVAAIIAVLIAVSIQAIPNRNAHARVVLGGVHAFELRIARVIEPLIDTVSGARWDPDLRKRVQAELKQLHHSAAFLSGQLGGEDPELGLTAEQLSALRMRVFDAELAMVNLAAAARAATGSSVPVPVRAQLAGELEQLQRHVRGYPKRPMWAGEDVGHDAELDGTAAYSDAPIDWPAPARRLHLAAYELGHAADELHTARGAELAASVNDAEDPVGREESPTAGPDAQSATPGDSAGGGAARGAADAQPAASAVGLPDADRAAGLPGPLRRAVQAALSTGLALWVGSLVSVSYQYWAAMPAYQVLGGTDGETYMKGTQRIVGTVAGAAVGFGLAILVGSNPAVLLPVIGLCVFASTYFRSVSAPLAAFWQMMMFAQLYELLGKLNTETIELRILETVIGAVIALAVAALVLPTRTRTKLAADTARLVRTVSDVTTMCLMRLRGDAGAAGFDRQTLAQQELAMTAQLRQVQATAAPLRRSDGALDVRGVEGQLTALWALLFYTRHLVAATEAVSPGSSALSTEQWDQLQALSADNFDALLAALNGRLPAEVHEDVAMADRDEAADDRALDLALHALERIDQTVAVLVDNLQPESSHLGRIRSASAAK